VARGSPLRAVRRITDQALKLLSQPGDFGRMLCQFRAHHTPFPPFLPERLHACVAAAGALYQL
jgi:hypothetical protein